MRMFRLVRFREFRARGLLRFRVFWLIRFRFGFWGSRFIGHVRY